MQACQKLYMSDLLRCCVWVQRTSPSPFIRENAWWSSPLCEVEVEKLLQKALQQPQPHPHRPFASRDTSVLVCDSQMCGRSSEVRVQRQTCFFCLRCGNAYAEHVRCRLVASTGTTRNGTVQRSPRTGLCNPDVLSAASDNPAHPQRSARCPAE